jgi:hypothetical protein
MEMGDVSWWGGNQEIAKPMTIAQFKMEDVCNLYSVIEFFAQKIYIYIEKGRFFIPFKLQMAIAQLCKNTFVCLCKHPNTSTIKGRNWLVECQSR